MRAVAPLVAALALACAPWPAWAADVTDSMPGPERVIVRSAPLIGERVVVSTTIDTTHQGSEFYDPSVFVDWDAGNCPATASAARTAAKGHFHRGMGFAVSPSGDFTNLLPISASVLIETAKQRVCLYDESGALADQVVVTGTPRLPPLLDNKPAKRWQFSGGSSISKALQSRFLIAMRGLKPVGGARFNTLYECHLKRFWINPSKLHVSATGGLSYNAAVTPDNSKNYDAPVPLPFHGRALLRFTGKLVIGAEELKPPTFEEGGAGLVTKGRWGKPALHVTGSFSAPGYRSWPGRPPCSTKLNFALSPFIDSQHDTATVMRDQGTAHMGTDPRHPDTSQPDDAGIGTPVPQDTGSGDEPPPAA